MDTKNPNTKENRKVIIRKNFFAREGGVQEGYVKVRV